MKRCVNSNRFLEIWSTYPPPYGGVSIHSLRLFDILKDKYSIVFKNFNGDMHLPEKGVYKVSKKEIFKYLFKRKQIIHLHSNRLLVWLIMCLYPKSTKILLTLHNQNLRKHLPFYEKIIIHIFLRKIKCLILNNEEFAQFLIETYKINPSKVITIPAFIPPQLEESEPLPEEIELFFNKHNKIISSFAWKLYKVNGRDVYGLEQIIDAFAQCVRDNSIGLLLIVPIIEDEEHYHILLEKIKKYKLDNSILIYNNSVRNGFDVWKRSDLFIRATTTDIEGISIKEALSGGTPVIATNVVDRPECVDLYNYGDVEELSKLMLRNLQQPKDLKDISIESGIDKIDKIYRKLTL